MGLKLYGHQVGACKNLKELYKNHRSAGAMMVTGGGKSFVAMNQMIAAGNNPNYHGISEEVDEDGRQKVEYDIVDKVVNNAEILYVAPTTDILLQIQKDIVEYVLGYSEAEVSDFSIRQIEELVKEAFPNLHLVCYQGLDSNKLYVDKNGKRVDKYAATPDLVILDEVHRSGAYTFKPNVEKLLGYNREEDNVNGKDIIPKNNDVSKGKEKIQVLSISATPERDVDDIDMIRYWDEIIGGYTKEELDNKKDYAIMLGLPEAVRQGIVAPPEIIAFDANLVDTEQYKYLVDQANNYCINPRLRNEFEEKVKLINKSIFGEDYEDFHKRDRAEQERIKLEKNVAVMRKAIEEGKFNLHGKYITFSKSRQFVDGHAIEEQEEQEEQEEVQNERDNPIIAHLKGQFRTVKRLITRALNNRRIVIEEKYLSSQGQDARTNAENLVEFDNRVVDENTNLCFLTATQKLDEGIHVKRLTGAFMLKPICEAGEKISLRGQSIRFLQEVGRTLSAGTRESRVIFDYCNNVFRQGINKVLTEDQMIDAFRLNPCQNLLAETYRTMSAKIPPRGQLTAEYGKLVQILNILRKYYSPLHADIINGNLDHVLDRAEFIEHRDTIEQEINELDLFRARRNLCSYPIAQNLRKARKLLNSKKGNENAGIGFSTFNIKELAELGIFDRISQDGLKDYEDGCIEIDDNGFVVACNLENLMFQHIETGTPYNPEGIDVFGYREGQFNEKTGRDEEGFDRRGFNDKNIHRVTGTIHDERGFMADGNNILTGTTYDLAGFDYNGYKKFDFLDIDPKTKEYKKIKDVVVDREGFFHRVFVDPETGEPDYSKVSPVGKQYYQLLNKTKIDSHGFLSSNGQNLYTKAAYFTGSGRGSLSQLRIIKREFTVRGKKIKFITAFDKYGKAFSAFDGGKLNSSNVPGYAYIQGIGYFDIDGFDMNGFNEEGVHRDTGTRYDTNGRTREEYSEESIAAERAIKQFAEVGYLTEEFCLKNGLTSEGRDIITGTQIDIYGFTSLNRADPRYANEKNEFGFIAAEIPVHVYSEPINSKYKKYSVNPYREVNVNILGTNENGVKSNGELHESLSVLGEYTKACIEGDMDDETYFETVAKERKMLVKEVKQELVVGMNKAFELYRLCPYLCKNEKVKNTFDKIFKASPDKLNDKVFSRCPKLRSTLTIDIIDINERLEELNESLKIKNIRNDRKRNLKLEKKRLEAKLSNFKALHNNGEGDGR